MGARQLKNFTTTEVTKVGRYSCKANILGYIYEEHRGTS